MKIKSALIATTAAVGMFAAGFVVGAQPHMQNALASLQNAKAELQAADHNKGGHRAKAIGLIEQAINQVQMGMAAAS